MNFDEDGMALFFRILLIIQLALLIAQVGAVANRLAEIVEKMP